MQIVKRDKGSGETWSNFVTCRFFSEPRNHAVSHPSVLLREIYRPPLFALAAGIYVVWKLMKSPLMNATMAGARPRARQPRSSRQEGGGQIKVSAQRVVMPT